VSALAPVKVMWRQLWGARGLSAWFLLFAATPFVLLRMTADDSDIERAAWGFATYFALMWASAIHSLVRPERLDGWLVVRVVATCAVGGTALAVFLEEALDPDMTQLGWTVLGVGVPEELAKAAPILVFMLLRNRPWTTRMYLYMGALSGLTFGVVEAVEYSSLYEQFAGVSAHASITTQTIWRLLADGLFHGCCAAVSAYFIGLGYWRRDRMWHLVAIGIGLAAVLHGVYDRWAANWVGTATAVIIVALFVGYVRSGDAIALTMAGEPAATRKEPA
jgi:RsiW-degrading membrane proteinase PrsW (M82 family)